MSPRRTSAIRRTLTLRASDHFTRCPSTRLAMMVVNRGSDRNRRSSELARRDLRHQRCFLKSKPLGCGRSMAFCPELDSSRLPDPSTPKPDHRVAVEAESGVGRDSADPTSFVKKVRVAHARTTPACHPSSTDHGPRVQWRRSQPRVRMLESRSSLKETSHACSRPAPEQTHHPYHR